MDDISRREKKRITQAGLRRLRAQPGWDPQTHQPRSADDLLTELTDTTNRNQAYSQASECKACENERRATGDETALCEPHLMEAMGL